MTDHHLERLARAAQIESAGRPQYFMQVELGIEDITALCLQLQIVLSHPQNRGAMSCRVRDLRERLIARLRETGMTHTAAAIEATVQIPLAYKWRDPF